MFDIFGEIHRPTKKHVLYYNQVPKIGVPACNPKYVTQVKYRSTF